MRPVDRQLSDEERRQLKHGAKRLIADMKAIAAAAPQELFGDRFVAVKGGKVIGSNESMEALLEGLPDLQGRCHAGIAVGYVEPRDARILL